MDKYPIGFNSNMEQKRTAETNISGYQEACQPKQSVVQIYFPSRDRSWAYYNDAFDLKVGDLVYVEGKLEGKIGRVTEVHYSFKIKISDYKKVISVVDSTVRGEFYLAGSHIVSFDRTALPYAKVIRWFKAPDNEKEYISGSDDSERFSLENLSEMNLSQSMAERGHAYYMENRVCFITLDGIRGHAIVEGSENYEIEFQYAEGEICNLTCSCFCSGACKHGFAAMLQLRETLELIMEHYKSQYGDYFAAISKDTWLRMVMNKKVSGKITVEG